VEPHGNRGPRRVAVVARDAAVREALVAVARRERGVQVVAWAEDAELLQVLSTRIDVCVCAEPPPCPVAEWLRGQGAVLAVLPEGGDPAGAVVAALAREGVAPPPVRRPALSPRQRDVLVAYVAGSALLPTVARSLGMDRETLKTHLRRIRAKYDEVGRPAPTRRDLYVRAVEDGLVEPPAEGRPAPG
jgi:DNA-binding CsgD family transcriptional regulator